MLPATPCGHCGAPLAPARIGTAGSPSRASAARAQARAVANSVRRLATAVAMTASSSGNSLASGTSPNASSTATPAGRICSSTSALPGRPGREWPGPGRPGRERPGPGRLGREPLGREDLLHATRPVGAQLELARIAQRYFLEEHSVLPDRARDVQVAVDHRQGAEP